MNGVNIKYNYSLYRLRATEMAAIVYTYIPCLIHLDGDMRRPANAARGLTLSFLG